MDRQSIVYTNNNCIGCNKCIKVCSAIGACVSKEEDGRARIDVDGSKCVACGSCIDVCVHGAREFADDTERFLSDLQNGEKISLLLAPAFRANYPDEYDSVLGGLKNMGIDRIISVSFGADITTWGYINYIRQRDFTGGISQPCPAVVSYIERYIPELIPKLFPVQSPLMCAAIYARKVMGITGKLAFISPCIAKKLEIEDPHNEGLVQYNVTFDHLMDYAREHGIKGPSTRSEIEYGLGSFYPTPGGLAENVRWFLGDGVYIRQVEGERHLYEWMHLNADRIKNDGTPFLFIDALNCSKGCICGTAVDPERGRTDDALYALLDIREGSKKSESGSAWSRPDTPEERLAGFNAQFADLNLDDYIRGYTDRSAECRYDLPDESQLDAIFKSMNKLTEESRHIDCTCCGYDGCRQMAVAIHNGFNRKENCIYYEKTMVQELEVEKSFAEEANRAKTTFLERVSHEIRTPINTVLGMNEMILRESGDESITGYSTNIKEAGHALLDLVSSILDYAELEGSGVNADGSKLSIKLPPNISERDGAAQGAGAAGDACERFTASFANILVVDDIPMNLTVFTYLLKRTKMNIDCASSGREALEMSEKKKYDIIFLDHMMPGMDGIETLKRMRSSASDLNRTTPVICLTANAIAGARKQYEDAGFDDYMTKPIDAARLDAIIERYLVSSADTGILIISYINSAVVNGLAAKLSAMGYSVTSHVGAPETSPDTPEGCLAIVYLPEDISSDADRTKGLVALSERYKGREDDLIFIGEERDRVGFYSAAQRILDHPWCDRPLDAQRLREIIDEASTVTKKKQYVPMRILVIHSADVAKRVREMLMRYHRIDIVISAAQAERFMKKQKDGDTIDLILQGKDMGYEPEGNIPVSYITGRETKEELLTLIGENTQDGKR